MTPLDTPCIGWYDPDGCPEFGDDMHGCKLGNHRGDLHECECGAVWYGTAWGGTAGREEEQR